MESLTTNVAKDNEKDARDGEDRIRARPSIIVHVPGVGHAVCVESLTTKVAKERITKRMLGMGKIASMHVQTSSFTYLV